MRGTSDIEFQFQNVKAKARALQKTRAAYDFRTPRLFLSPLLSRAAAQMYSK